MVYSSIYLGGVVGIHDDKQFLNHLESIQLVNREFLQKIVDLSLCLVFLVAVLLLVLVLSACVSVRFLGAGVALPCVGSLPVLVGLALVGNSFAVRVPVRLVLLPIAAVALGIQWLVFVLGRNPQPSKKQKQATVLRF